ncbi:MAG TPA: PA2779 family protein [Rhizobacter sp.]|nr:PA2779 family protein [Rhizobacter sp.]
MSRSRRLIAFLVAVGLSFSGFVPSAQAAGLISTEQVAASVGLHGAADERAHLLAVLERDDVAALLAERGVSIEQARSRVQALTDAEAVRLAAEIDQAPAGASELVGTVILVFVILLFTDILGFTRIFPFVTKAE